MKDIFNCFLICYEVYVLFSVYHPEQCQTTLVRAGGLEALAQLLAQLSDVAQSDGKAAQLAIYVAQTLDNCISLNG